MKRMKMAPENCQTNFSKEQKELLSAVESGTLRQVQKLASKSQLINTEETFDYTLLVTALRRQHKKISEYLMEKVTVVKAPVKIKSYCTPIYYAVKMDDLEIFKALCARGASIFDRNDKEDTALELAMLENRIGIINFVLDYIKKPENSKNLKPDREIDVAIFHLACWAGDPAAIEIFKNQKFSARSRSIFGRHEWRGFTPLHFALANKASFGAMIYLLRHDGIDFNAQDQGGRTCIHLGIKSSHDFMFRRELLLDLMNRSSDNELINPVDKNGLSHFHILCSVKSDDDITTEHTDLVKRFIDNGVDVNSSVSPKDDKFPGFTALHFAAKNFSFEMMELLLEHGAFPTKADQNGSTPLHMIFQDKYGFGKIDQERRLEIVKSLLKHGADPAAKDFEDRTPLHYKFCEHGDSHALDETERLLLSNDRSGINHTDAHGLSYLHIACMGGDLHVVETLVSNGAPVNAFIESTSYRFHGFTPLHFAVESNSFEIVEFLLDHGADVDAVDDGEETPLHFACCHEETKILYGSHEHYKVNQNDTFWLPTRTNHLKIVQLLIDHGADVEAENYSGCTPLMNNFEVSSIFENHSFWSYNRSYVEDMEKEMLHRQQEIMNILLRHGADINTRSLRNNTILHRLAKQYHRCASNVNSAELVLKAGADVNAVNDDESTPLHVAVFVSMNWEICGHKMVNLFLKYGANINAKDKYSNTPLHTIFAECHNPYQSEIVCTNFLNYPSVDVNAQNKCGKTPLHMALSQHNHSCIEKLLEFGADISVEDSAEEPPIYCLFEYFKGPSNSPKNETDLAIVIGVVTHIKKLRELKFRVSEKVIKYYDLLSQKPSLQSIASIDMEIDKEMQQMKDHKLSINTSMYDTLSKNANDMAKCVMNKSLQAAALSIVKKQSYKYFGDMIKRQYERGIKRFAVLEPAKKALNLVTNVNWPDCCSEEILSYLCDENLEKLIESMPHAGLCKRSVEELPQLQCDQSRRY